MPSNYNLNTHHRRSIRLKDYDYSKAGLYFITICTQHRINLFGKIIDNRMILNIAGEMINKIWLEIPKICPNTKLHEYIIMPNHFHAILEITKQPVGAESISAPNNTNSISNQSARNNVNYISVPMDENVVGNGMNVGANMEFAPTGSMGIVSLPKIVQTFKRYTTIKYIKMVKQNLLSPFKKRVWQRNYYEHIIRDERSYLRIVEYIINNPLKWENDKYYIPNP